MEDISSRYYASDTCCIPSASMTDAALSTNRLPEAAVSLVRYRTLAPTARAQVQLAQHMFTFLLAGEKTVRFAGAQATLHPTQFILLAAGNCLMSEKAAAPDAEYHSLLLLFDQQVLVDFFSRHAAWLGPSGRPATSQPFLQFAPDDFLRHFVHSLDCLLPARGTPTLPPALAHVKLEELLLYLALHYPTHLSHLRRLGQEAPEEVRIRQAVTAHVDSPITVEELAFLCHLSLSTFKRRFAQLYGTSPTHWLLQQRMAKAAHLLRESPRHVGELAGELGYENLSSFIESFKQFYGVTPKQYQLSG
jgi:AraC-like DNA-binding protein